VGLDSDPLRVPDQSRATFRTIQAYLVDTAAAVDDEFAQEVSLLDTLIQHHDAEPGDTLSDQALDRLSDLAEFAPTTNSDLADGRDVETGAEIHAYLESELDGYYRRDSNRMLRPTEEAQQIVATRS
jgi:Ca-activated chloride channel family protein